MKIEIVTPEDYMGDGLGLNRRAAWLIVWMMCQAEKNY